MRRAVRELKMHLLLRRKIPLIIFQLILICVFASSCDASTTSSPQPIQVSTSTSSILNATPEKQSPTEIIATSLVTSSLDTPTEPTSTQTPEAGVSDTGPWLSYFSDDRNLVITDLDSNGVIPLSIPLSPVEFPVSGSIGEGLLAVLTEERLSSEGVLPNVSLVIYRLPSLTLVETIPLLNNLGLLEDKELAGEAYQSVREPPQWSPNGRYLAFVGAIENPSGDLYVYDARTGGVKHLTYGKNHVGRLWWSPDSKWIVHEEVLGFHGWNVESIWAAKFDGSEVRWLFSPQMRNGQVIIGWTSPHSFVSFDRNIGWGECHIRHVDITESHAAILFAGCAREESSTLDPSTGAVAFAPYLFNAYVSEEELQEMEWPKHGVYLVSPASTTPNIVVPDANSFYWDSTYEEFVTDLACSDDPTGFQAFKSNGSLHCQRGPRTYPSPDGSYIVTFDPMLVLYDELGNELSMQEDIAGGIISWLPDSRGFLLQSSDGLMYISVPELEAKPLHNGPNLHRKQFIWIFSD